eukprot:3112310-Pyramimonas_sp.AAC.1
MHVVVRQLRKATAILPAAMGNAIPARCRVSAASEKLLKAGEQDLPPNVTGSCLYMLQILREALFCDMFSGRDPHPILRSSACACAWVMMMRAMQ